MLITDGDVDPAARQCIQDILDQQHCQSARYRQSTASTNAWALGDLGDGVAENELPRLYFTDEQTAGRGRHGRRWQSNDQSIALSLVMPWPLGMTGPGKLLSIAVGVGVARAIEFTCAPLQTRLKWPNDVYIDGGKVAGILIETNQVAVDRVVIGIGINVNEAPDHAALLKEACQTQVAQPKSLAGVTGRRVSRNEILLPVIEQLVAATAQLHNDAPGIVREFQSRCMLVGSTVRVSDGSGQQSGTCLGINEEGELAIQLADRIHHCNSGEAHQVRVSP